MMSRDGMMKFLNNGAMKFLNLTDEQIIKLPTNRLYNLFKSIRTFRPSWDAGMRENETTKKADVEVERLTKLIKVELDKRPHIERDKNDKPSSKLPSYYFDERSHTPKGTRPPIIKDAESCIGKQVVKRSGNPFKSRNKYNTVTEVTINPHTNNQAFKFVEDTSIVDVNMCKERNESK